MELEPLSRLLIISSKGNATMSTPFPMRKHVDIDGRVRCWSIPDGNWVRKYPIDVREGLETGVISQFPPEDVEAKADVEVKVDELLTSIASATSKDLAKIVQEQKLNVDLGAFEKLADKRIAVQQALEGITTTE